MKTFIDTLNTAENLIINIGPWFILALVVRAVLVNLLPRDFPGAVFEKSEFLNNVLAALVATFTPFSSWGFIQMGAKTWPKKGELLPILAFISTGATGGLPALIVTFALGWHLVLLRLVFGLIFGLITSLFLMRLTANQLLTPPVEISENELSDPDFSEVFPLNEEKGVDIWPKLFSFFARLKQVGRVFIPWFILSLIVASLLSTFISASYIQSVLGNYKTIFLLPWFGLPFYLTGGAEIPLLSVLVDKGLLTSRLLILMFGFSILNFPTAMAISRWLGRKFVLRFFLVFWLVLLMIGLLVTVFESFF
jgi:uncharacterized membrane protein YraQ (UPF0718 family)